MSSGQSARRTANRILSRLSDSDFDLLAPDLEGVDLPVHKRLEVRNRPIDDVYFIESGFASVVADSANQRSIEVGLVGREGMTGLAVILATDRSPNETTMRLGGSGQRLAAARLRERMEQSATLRHALLNYGHAFHIQASHTALVNGRGKLEERLARWLLMAHDRVDGDDLALTHEFLAASLGVRRPGVTIALNLLINRGVIQSRRGAISVIDREGLESTANGAYGAPEAEFQRLFG